MQRQREIDLAKRDPQTNGKGAYLPSDPPGLGGIEKPAKRLAHPNTSREEHC